MIEFFPNELIEPRPQQREGLEFINKAFKAGSKFVVLESPTGSGKSGVAMAVSRAFGGGIIACPTIQLQKQYLSDFKNVSPLIGRGRFPCLKKDPSAAKSIPLIKSGKIPERPSEETSCAVGPCVNKPMAKRMAIHRDCETFGGCPYTHSIERAQMSETIISNLHSLMYSVSMSEKIEPRKVLIIDEAHDLDKFMRDFLKIKFKIRRVVSEKELVDLKSKEDWYGWLSARRQLATLTTDEMRDSYNERLEKLELLGKVVFHYWNDEDDGQLWVELTPVNIGGACQAMLFSLADKIVLMSGTIYSKKLFLDPLGVDLNTASFLRIPSDFPVKNRQVAMPKNLGLDLSHKMWNTNLPVAIEQIKFIADHHKEHKGVIHTSSYKMSREITPRLSGLNVISHNSFNFQQKLDEFYNSKKPCVFITPICAQGVDFKDDLARWQIIVRPQYGALTDPYVKHLLDNKRWDLYNYKTSIVFGQQLGRIVRSNTDYGITYLLSSTFNNLIKKTNHLLPEWLKKGFV